MAVGQESTITRGFLFADLRGYTDFVEQHGAAAAAALLTRYRALAREAIGQFGGAEIKTEGDSFYVVFDSVSSAVRCGLAITTAARAAADEPIRVGVGIHAGETIEADGGYVGSPVNIAARICAQAGPGEVLVSETVRALTTTRPPGPVQVARPTSAEGHRRADRALRGRGGGGRDDRVAVDASPTAVASGTRRAGRGRGVAWWPPPRVVGWLALQPSTGLPSGTWTIGVHVPTSGAWRIGRHRCSQRGAARHRPGERGRRRRRRGAGLEGIRHGREATMPRIRLAEPPPLAKMAGDPRTIAAVGPFTSPVAASTIPITNRAGLLECSPSNSYSGLTKPEHGALEFRAAHPKRINYVRLSPSTTSKRGHWQSFVTHELDAESALVIADPDWQDDATDFVEAFTALGGQVAQAKLTAGRSPAAALGPLDDSVRSRRRRVRRRYRLRRCRGSTGHARGGARDPLPS